MESKQLNAFLNSRRRLNLVLWGAFAWSIALITGVAFYLAQVLPPPAQAGGMLNSMRISIVLAGTATLTLIVELVFRRHYLSDGRLLATASAADRNARISTLEPAEKPQARMVVLWTTYNIISWALGESVILQGLVLSILTHELARIYPFLAVTLVSHLLTFPRFDELLARVRAIAG